MPSTQSPLVQHRLGLRYILFGTAYFVTLWFGCPTYYVASNLICVAETEQATNGVVLATEKKLRSTLIDESTVKRISVVSPNIGLAYSGMGPDSRLLVRRARKQAQVVLQRMHQIQYFPSCLIFIVIHFCARCSAYLEVLLRCRHTIVCTRSTSLLLSYAGRQQQSCRSLHVSTFSTPSLIGYTTLGSICLTPMSQKLSAHTETAAYLWKES